ncbi:MAG: pyroglutamyl-peptidase I [Anaerolineae bacterium]
MTVLLTGFEPFGKVTDNPSQRIVEHFQQKGIAHVSAVVLPVDYHRASEHLLTLIEQAQPQAIILLGVAQMREALSLERIAININDASLPDNAGQRLHGQRIVADAPVGYWSTLPLDTVYQAIDNASIAVKYSNHAGAYLCNHVMYCALHYLSQYGLDIPCGFIHVPAVEAVPLSEQIRAVELVVRIVQTRQSV